MPEEIVAPHVAGPEGTATCENNNSGTDTKWRRILRLLANGARLTRFDAERSGDHAFNSTVADLKARGIRVAREPITLEGRFGRIHCKRYWLEPEERETALALLGDRP